MPHLVTTGCGLSKKPSDNKTLLKKCQDRTKLWVISGPNITDCEDKIADKELSVLFWSDAVACKIVTSFSLSCSHHQNMCLGLEKQPTSKILKKGKGSKKLFPFLKFSVFVAVSLAVNTFLPYWKAIRINSVLPVPVASRASLYCKDNPRVNRKPKHRVTIESFTDRLCTHAPDKFTSRWSLM